MVLDLQVSYLLVYGDWKQKHCYQQDVEYAVVDSRGKGGGVESRSRGDEGPRRGEDSPVSICQSWQMETGNRDSGSNRM